MTNEERQRILSEGIPYGYGDPQFQEVEAVQKARKRKSTDKRK